MQLYGIKDGMSTSANTSLHQTCIPSVKNAPWTEALPPITLYTLRMLQVAQRCRSPLILQALVSLDAVPWQPFRTPTLQRLLDDCADVLARNERLLVVAASTFIMSLSHTALRPVMPTFVKSFGVGAAAVGATLSVYAIARLLMNIPAGLLADRYGRRPLLISGPFITALGMLWTGYATSYTSLLAGRWLTGIGSALQMLGAQLFLADISEPSNRARHLGTNHQAALAGSLLGPALGGFLADRAGMRAPFAFTGAAALLAALYGLARLPETSARLQPHAEAPSAGQPAEQQAAPEASTSGHEHALPGATSQEWASRMLKRMRHRVASWRAQPAWRQLLCSQDFRAIASLNAVMFATTNGARSMLMPLLAVQRFGMSATSLGLIFAGMACISLVVTQPAAWVADQWGRKAIIFPASVVLAASVLLMASAGGTATFLLAAAVYSVSHACIGANPYAYVSDVMPAGAAGLGLSMYRCAGDIGLMVGPAMLGFLADMTTVRTALGANAILLLACAVFFHLQAQEPRNSGVLRPSPVSRQPLDQRAPADSHQGSKHILRRRRRRRRQQQQQQQQQQQLAAVAVQDGHKGAELYQNHQPLREGLPHANGYCSVHIRVSDPDTKELVQSS